MIVVIKNDSNPKQMDNLVKWIKNQGLRINLSKGENTTVMGLIGDTSKVDIDLLSSLDIVESVKRIQSLTKTPIENSTPKTRLSKWADIKSAEVILF